MNARFGFATLTVLVWAVSAHAQYYEHPRAPYWNHERSPPPALPPPRHELAEHTPPPHHAWEDNAKAGREADGSVCDNPGENPGAAIAACGRIIARGPVRNGYSLVVAYANRGQAYEDKADYPHAIADFSEAIRRAPEVPDYYALRGGAQEYAGDLAAARADFDQAMKLDPANQAAQSGLSQIATRSAVIGATVPPPVSAAAADSPPAPVAPLPPAAAGGAAVASVAPPVPGPSVATAPAPVSVASAAPLADRSPTSRSSDPATNSPAGATSPVAAARTSGETTVASAPPPAFVAAPSTAASHGPRVALVIGNGAYVNANALPNPPNDAHAMAGVLRQIGFDVEEGENLNHAAMESLFQDFLHKAQHASVVLLFYAGHGMQVDGKNYLIPVDAKLADASDLPFETIEIDKLLDSLGDPGHTNIILLDACRDNPLARSFYSHLPATRSIRVADGLAAYSAVGTGTLIAYATAPGQTALDGQGKDSPFTASLLHYLPTPGLEIRQVLTRVRAEVAAQTDNRQIPWDNSSLMGDVVLVAQPAAVAKSTEH